MNEIISAVIEFASLILHFTGTETVCARNMNEDSNSNTAIIWNTTVKRRTAKWVYALLSHFITGGATALTAGSGAALAHSVGVDVQPLNLQQLGVVFVSSGIFGAIAFLRQSPLPGPTDTEIISKQEIEKPK